MIMLNNIWMASVGKIVNFIWYSLAEKDTQTR